MATEQDRNSRGKSMSTAEHEAACGIDEVGNFQVEEDEREIVVRAELPGFSETELDVQVHGEVLAIRAGRFYREVRVPAGVSPGQVQATYINGVLQLRIPRG